MAHQGVTQQFNVMPVGCKYTALLAVLNPAVKPEYLTSLC